MAQEFERRALTSLVAFLRRLTGLGWGLIFSKLTALLTLSASYLSPQIGQVSFLIVTLTVGI